MICHSNDLIRVITGVWTILNVLIFFHQTCLSMDIYFKRIFSWNELLEGVMWTILDTKNTNSPEVKRKSEPQEETTKVQGEDLLFLMQHFWEVNMKPWQKSHLYRNAVIIGHLIGHPYKYALRVSTTNTSYVLYKIFNFW